MRLAFLYSFFAALATLSNIAAQELTLTLIYPSFALAIVAGTGVGLVVKFLLDRRYIFKAATRPVSQDSKQFAAYTLTGIATTILFWSMEIGFDIIFNVHGARYIGAILGLSIGYMVKYQLDKRFVFIDRQP